MISNGITNSHELFHFTNFILFILFGSDFIKFFSMNDDAMKQIVSHDIVLYIKKTFTQTYLKDRLDNYS